MPPLNRCRVKLNDCIPTLSSKEDDAERSGAVGEQDHSESARRERNRNSKTAGVFGAWLGNVERSDENFSADADGASPDQSSVVFCRTDAEGPGHGGQVVGYDAEQNQAHGDNVSFPGTSRGRKCRHSVTLLDVFRVTACLKDPPMRAH